jgi:hypothetical protein
LQGYLQVFVWEKDRVGIIIDGWIKDLWAFVDAYAVQVTLEGVQEIILELVPKIQC